MIEAEASIDIRKPPAAVFAVIDDHGRMPVWIKSCSALRLTAPPDKVVGAPLEYAFRQGGRIGIMKGTITEYDPPRRLAMRFSDRAFTVEIAFGVEPAAGGARVTQTLAIEPRTLLGRLSAPLIRAGTRRQITGDNARLKQLLETFPAPLENAS